MTSEVYRWIMHRVMKPDQKLLDKYGTSSSTVLATLLAQLTPMPTGKPEDLFSVVVETSNDELILRITGKNAWGKAALTDWHEQTVQAEFKVKDDK